MSPPMIRTLFRYATNKGGKIVIEGIEVRSITRIGRDVAGDDRCPEVTVKRGYHHPRLYFLGVIK